MFQQACPAGIHHPTLQMGKARFREVKHFPQGHTAVLERTRSQTHSWLLPSVQWPPTPTLYLLPLLPFTSCACSPGTLVNGHTSCCRCHMSHGRKGLQLALTNGGLVPRPAVLSLPEGTQSWACRDFFPPSSPGTWGSLLMERKETTGDIQYITRLEEGVGLGLEGGQRDMHGQK